MDGGRVSFNLATLFFSPFFRIADLLGLEDSMIPTYGGDTIYLLYSCHLGCLFVFCFWYFPGGGFYGACCLAMIAYYGYLLAS